MKKGIALYIHIPFCKQKCKYCDFVSFSNKESIMIDYAKALKKEIIMRCNGKNIKSIFIGGGTPTYFSLDAWKIIGEAIGELDKEDEIEFSVEANPGTVTEDKLKELKKMGVNRISIGLQAWQDNLLKVLGRIHTISDFLNSYNIIRKFGFNNINIDLMFGLPEQSMEQWMETLNEIIKLNPEHISCYGLILEEGTKFYDLYDEGKLALPSEELERKMYAYSRDLLKKNGYFQYEISNFAKKNKQCKHNLVYWNLDDYIGCGIAAHSYINEYRYNNGNNINEYIKNLQNNKILNENQHKNSIRDDMEEFMFMGLRKIQGINIKEFENRFNKDIYDVYGKIINKYVGNGLLLKDGENIMLSPRGIEISNSIMCDFMLT